jgi:hypothetical protein
MIDLIMAQAETIEDMIKKSRTKWVSVIIINFLRDNYYLSD